MDRKEVEKSLRRYDIYVDWDNKRIVYRRDSIYCLSINNLKRIINLILDLLEKIDGRR
ncbi:MAG: hypothetical protein ACP5JX_04180 [Sulfurihydrogenibium sp.]